MMHFADTCFDTHDAYGLMQFYWLNQLITRTGSLPTWMEIERKKQKYPKNFKNVDIFNTDLDVELDYTAIYVSHTY